MLYKNFDYLDHDYITIKSRFMLTENRDEFFRAIEILAEKGQINAIQDYYFFKKREVANSKVNEQALLLAQKPLPNMEELYALGLFYDHAQFASVEEKRQAMMICKPFLKSEKVRRLHAEKCYVDAIAKGKQEMMDCMWDGPYMNGIISERLAQICILTGNLARVYETANSFAKENIKKMYVKIKDDEIVNFMYAVNASRNNAKNSYFYQELERLSNRELAIKNEIDGEAE